MSLNWGSMSEDERRAVRNDELVVTEANALSDELKRDINFEKASRRRSTSTRIACSITCFSSRVVQADANSC